MHYKKEMKIATFICFLLYSFLGGGLSLEAASLHAILVCDTDAISIGPSVEADYKNMLKEVKMISSQTGLKLNVTSFKKRDVHAGFFSTIKTLKVRADDVVLFYWSGHGYHSYAQNDIWPIFDFTYGETGLSLYDVTLALMQKSPRLIISIADCCNGYIDNSFQPIFRDGRKNNSKNNYKKLFSNSRGVYISSGCVVGEYSFGLNSSSAFLGIPAGGFFTNGFLQALHTLVKGSGTDLSWEMVFEQAIQQTEDYQLNDPEDPTVYQHPQYQKLSG